MSPPIRKGIFEGFGFGGGRPITEATKVLQVTDRIIKSFPEVERVLGKAGAAAYRAGEVKLQDFVGRRYSEEWGTTRYAKSLREILGPEEALKWRQEASARERDHGD